MALECIDSDVVRIIRRAKALYLRRIRTSSEPCGMCDCISFVLYDPTLYSDFDTLYLRIIINFKFNRETAVSKFGADTSKSYWWPKKDATKRLEYFDWMIEQYPKEI